METNYFVPCSVTSLSMVHLATIWKGIAAGPTSVPVVVSDISSVDRRILERNSESGNGQGIWSKEDGCVFNSTIFCTFCSNQDTCLGLHVVATDSANVQFLNKVCSHIYVCLVNDLGDMRSNTLWAILNRL